MPWPSLADFIAMGGYAGYVWGSVGACAAGIALETWWLRRTHRRLVADLRRRPRRHAEPARPEVRATMPREKTA